MNKIISQYGGLKKEIYILFIGKLVTAMGSFVWPMLTFFLTKKLGLSDGTATLLIAIASLLSLPAALMGGKLADRFSRKRIIILFDILTVSFYTAAAIFPIGYHTALILFLAGLFQTIEQPAYDALNADFSTSMQREKAFSLSYLGFNLGFVVGAALAGTLFENHIQLAFLINGLAIGVSTLLIGLLVHPENAVGQSDDIQDTFGEYETPVEDSRSVLSVLKDRKAVLFLILIGCIASMPNCLVGILLPLQLKERMADGAALYGFLNSLNGFVVILFTPLLTLCLRKFSEIPKCVLGMLLFLMGIFLFAASPAVWLLYVGMFIYTLGEVVTVLGSNPYASRRIPASHRGRIGGITSLVYSLFASLTQFLISFILMATQSNYPLIWGIFMGIGGAATALYVLVYPMDRKRFPGLYPKNEVIL